MSGATCPLSRRRLLAWLAPVALQSLAPAGRARAQAVPPNVALPFYSPADLVRGMHRFWFAPRAREFAQEAGALRGALESGCTAPETLRARWQAAALAWDRLCGVAVGPVVQRRSPRQIDFTPIRPELVARALRQPPADLRALERVGTPAKGLGTLEWLLWVQPAAPDSAECRYALLLAREVEAEAQALQEAFDTLAARDWAADPDATRAALAEAVNQWIGGIERLRWERMERPMRSARGAALTYPRAASGSTAESWAARWQAVAALAAWSGQEVTPPGAALLPIETYLRGLGQNALADRLAQASSAAGRAVAAARPAAAGAVQAAAGALGELKRLAEANIAPALEVPLGFSDADGD